MERDELQLARTALRVLPGYKSQDFDQWFHSSNSASGETDRLKSNFAIVEFDFNKTKRVTLPPAYEHFNDVVNAHIDATSQNDPWGMLDDDLIVLKLSDQPNSQSGRLLLFRISYISKLLQRVFPHEHITPGEQRTLLQTLSGFTLRQAAELDSVSYETKKAQIKSTFRKTNIRGQQDLSSFLISHLLLEVAADFSRMKTNAESDEMFFAYVDQYMGTYVRASVIQETSDSRFRIIEIGDPSGIPVVCVHHLGLINFSEYEIAEIHRQGIRLICPLRHGAIGPLDERLSSDEQFQHAIAGIDLAASLIPDEKVTIVGMLSGCIYAAHYLKHHPANVRNLILFGASYKPANEKKSTSTFKSQLHELATDHQKMLDAAVLFLLDRVDQPEQLKEVMKESHNNCDADIAVIDELFSDTQQVKAMQHRLKHSSNSIAHDLQTQAISDWQPLLENESEADIHFIHGGADKLIPIDDISKLVDSHEHYHLHTIKEAGNWLYGRFTTQTFSIVRHILDE